MAELAGAKRTEVIKNALTVYYWFVRQALTGSRVVARTQTGEEVAIETAELAVLEGKGNRLSPEELGLLAKWLDGEPEVPEGPWYKRFSGMIVCGVGGLIKTLLLPGQAPKGQRVA